MTFSISGQYINDIALTSVRRHHVAPTSVRWHILLGWNNFERALKFRPHQGDVSPISVVNGQYSDIVPILWRRDMGILTGNTSFSRNRQEYPFLQVSEIFLSRPAISAQALKAVSVCQSLLSIAQSCSFQPHNLLLAQ